MTLPHDPPSSVYRPQPSYHHMPSGTSASIERDRFGPPSRRSPPLGPQEFYHNPSAPPSYHQPRPASSSNYPQPRPQQNRPSTEPGPQQRSDQRPDNIIPSGPPHASSSTTISEQKSSGFPSALTTDRQEPSGPSVTAASNGPKLEELKEAVAKRSSLATPVTTTEVSENVPEDYFSSKPASVDKNEEPAKDWQASLPPSPLPTEQVTTAPEIKSEPGQLVDQSPEPKPLSSVSSEAEGEDEEEGLNETDVIGRMTDLDTQIATLESRLVVLQQEKTAEQNLLGQHVPTPAPSPSPEPAVPEPPLSVPHLDSESTPDDDNDELEPTHMAKKSTFIIPQTLPEKILKLNNEMVHTHEAADMKYKLDNPIKAISDYNFYSRNESLYNDMKQGIMRQLQSRRKQEYEKGRQLQLEYKGLYDKWLISCRALDEEIASSSAKSLRGKVGTTSTSADGNFDDDDDEIGVFRRPGRGYHNADTVRSEAEFMEVLASLEWEDSRDPKNRAKLTSAKIPNMIIDETDRTTVYADSNNIVKNPNLPLKRLNTDGVDVFTEEEHRLFCEGYKVRPKQFGFIANHMGNIRTFEECVLHYYRTKKTVDYKAMANATRRRGAGARKGRRRARTGVNANIHTAAKARLTVDGDDAEKELATETTDDQPTPQPPPIYPRQHSHRERMPDEEIAALLELGSSGRPRRAAAPVFGGPGSEKREQPDNEQPQPKPKRARGGKKATGKGRGSGAAIIPPLEEPQMLPNIAPPPQLYQQPLRQPEIQANAAFIAEPVQMPIKQEANEYYQQDQSRLQPTVQQQMDNLVGVSKDLKDREVDAISALAGLFGGIEGMVPAPSQYSPSQTPQQLPLQVQEQQYVQPPLSPTKQLHLAVQETAQTREHVRILPALEPKPQQQQQVEDTSALGFLSSAAATVTVAPTASSTPSQPSETEQSEQEQPNDEQSSNMSGQSLLKRNNMISSYWSVHEMDLFPKLLVSYGTQWEEVSKHLKAKTTTMVCQFLRWVPNESLLTKIHRLKTTMREMRRSLAGIELLPKQICS
ncbi:hypothetical protein V1509DRAFT_673140 [Lipomyces kononenkoae]